MKLQVNRREIGKTFKKSELKPLFYRPYCPGGLVTPFFDRDPVQLEICERLKVMGNMGPV